MIDGWPNINLLLLALCDKGKYAKLCDGLVPLILAFKSTRSKQLKKGNMISATEICNVPYQSPFDFNWALGLSSP